MKDGCIIFLWDNYALFCHNYITEFVKNADSIYVIVVTPFSRKVSLATIGVCVFVRFTSVAALFVFTGEASMERKKHYQSPEVDLLRLNLIDIISTSVTNNPPADDDLDKDIGEWDGEM